MAETGHGISGNEALVGSEGIIGGRICEARDFNAAIPTMPNTMPTLCIATLGPICPRAAQVVAAEQSVAAGRNACASR
jgi:hypothetical protein